MKDFFKKFGLGILYLFILPFGLVFVLLFSIVGLGMVFFLFIKSIVLFFQGRKLKIDLPEDEQAAKLIEAQKSLVIEKSANNGYNQPQQVQPQTINHTTNIFNNYSDQLMSVFNQSQYPANSIDAVEDKPDVIESEPLQIEETKLEIKDNEEEVEPINKQTEEQQIDLEENDIVSSEYVPLTPKQEDVKDDYNDQEEDSEEGIDIEYGD